MKKILMALDQGTTSSRRILFDEGGAVHITYFNQPYLKNTMIGAPVEGCEDTGETLSVLSLSYVSVQESEDMSPAWLADTYDMEQEVVWSMLEQDFKRSLTLRQQEVFDCCLIRGMSLSSYAREKGLDVSTVHKTKLAIRKKAKIFLKGIPKNE